MAADSAGANGRCDGASALVQRVIEVRVEIFLSLKISEA